MHARRNWGKLIAVLCAIISLWGAGVSLVAVLFNLSIGFSNSDADFNEAFLDTTVNSEYDLIQSYTRINENIKRDQTERIGLMQLLENMQSRFDPARTNLRFSVTDTDGALMLTNDPLYGKEQELLASSVRHDSITLTEQHYQVQKHFSLTECSFSELLSMSKPNLLSEPGDYENWFFTYDLVDAAYHGGLDAIVLSGEYIDYLKFPTLHNAQNYDYQNYYGSYSEWTVVNATAEAETANAQAHLPVTYEDDPGRPDSESVNPVLVKVTAYADVQGEQMPLERYYALREQGVKVRAENENLEQHLSSGYDITVNAAHAESQSVLIRTYLPADLPVRDTIKSNYAVFRVLFDYSEQFVIAMFVGIVLTVIACISMCTAAGHHGDTDRPSPSRVHKIAYEFFWVLPLLAVAAGGVVLLILSTTSASYRMIAIFGIGMSLCISACCILWLYTTAVRIKCGTFWSSFFFSRMLRGFFGLFRNQFAVSAIVTLWLIGLLCLNLFAAVEERILWLPAFGLDLLTLAGILYAVYAYFELHKRADRMKTGDFAPVQHALPLSADFGKFDCSLGEITDSVGEIVARQTKAEHLRTELITNVSHDLKTPLTSIVNYIDLLSREEMPSPAAREYLDVLRRQAARLKKLTIDLVDASKASSGSLTVELMPTELGVLISQISGEYEDRLAERQLSLVCTTPEEPLIILADGRQIWRVFDNLLGNACKYAMPGTRVYLGLTATDSAVTVSLKNISASPLNISPDELMERFVRGDSSRHTEGSGLGLSIARDLTALQQGTLYLSTDGDLFKAILQFPRYFPETAK